MNANVPILNEFAGRNTEEVIRMLNETIRQQQAENDAWQAKYEADYAKAFENGYAIGLSHGKDLVNNG